MTDSAPLLRVDDLEVSFSNDQGSVRALDGISFSIGRGQRVGVVGESGCGKSTIAMSIMRLLDEPAARVNRGAVRLGGVDLLRLSEREMCSVRGRRISMVFQEPMTSLDPVCTVGSQVTEALTIHRRLGRREARDQAVRMLERVGFAHAQHRMQAFPHQLSGGMRQRVMIAIALICQPELLIADEPTTALDMTIQAQILELLGDLQRELGMAVMLITHDLAVLAGFAESVIVMYAGQIVEEASVHELFSTPAHPYTRALIATLPSRSSGMDRLATIPGRVPELRELPVGCRFQDRCPRVVEGCRAGDIPMSDFGGARRVRCLRPGRGQG